MTESASPMIVSMSSFAAREAARITGVSPEMQRDWRKRGLLAPTAEGHARFCAQDLAQLIIMRRLGESRVALGLARDIADRAAASLIRQSGWVFGACAPMAPESWDPASIRNSPSGDEARIGALEVSSEAMAAATQLTGALDQAYRFIMVQGGEIELIDEDIYGFLHLAQDQDPTAGAIFILVDLLGLARGLVIAAGRPLYRIETTRS